MFLNFRFQLSCLFLFTQLSYFRSSFSAREPPSTTLHVPKQKYIICCKIQLKGGIREKFRICESPRAKRFLEAGIYLQEQLYTRVADFEVDSQVFRADFYYHKNCLEG